MRSAEDIAKWDASIAKAAAAEAEKREQNRKMRKDASGTNQGGTNSVAPFLNQ